MSVSNEELYDLIEQAAAAATGREDTDITEYIIALEDEWITDVDALRKLDPSALDELLPRLLSQELQHLIHQKDRRYRPRTASNRNGRWKHSWQQHGPPKKDVAKPTRSKEPEKKDVSTRQATYTKNDKQDPSHPPAVAPVAEEESSMSSSSSMGKDTDQCGPVTSMPILSELPLSLRPVTSTTLAKTTIKRKKQLNKSKNNKDSSAILKILDLFDRMCSIGCERKEPFDLPLKEEQPDEEEANDDNQLQQIDATQHAIARAKEQFPTREALEDAIRDCLYTIEEEKKQAEIIATSKSVFDIEAKELISPTEDRLCQLYPLRLVLPTVADLATMLKKFQDHREKAMREFDIEMANSLQTEIDELQLQIEEEERYLLKKKLVQVVCVSCGEEFVPSSSLFAEKNTVGNSDDMKNKKTKKEKHCEECRKVFGSEETDEEKEEVELESVVKRLSNAFMSGIASVDSRYTLS